MKKPNYQINPLEWVDPPPKNARTKPWIAETVEELKQRPGKWAKVAHTDKQHAMGQVASRFKERGCEVTSRMLPNLTGKPGCDLYAKWPE